MITTIEDNFGFFTFCSLITSVTERVYVINNFDLTANNISKLVKRTSYE